MIEFGMALAGGGARGAYSAGVLRYLYTELPKKLGFQPWPKIVSGTSAGALNGYFAASQELMEIHRCTELWSNFTVGQVYNLPFEGWLKLIPDLRSAAKRSSFLDPSPLGKLIEKEAARRTIRHSIGSGACQAFIVSATQLHGGDNVLFVDTADPNFRIPPPPHGRLEYHKLYPHHLMASSAIPLVFPPVEIDGVMYMDGGLRQNAPLHPLIQGKICKILVLGTKVMKPMSKNPAQKSLSLIAGKTLNALTLDPVERDNLVADRINNIIDWGVDQYGPEFAKKLKSDMGLEKIEILHLRPSMDLGKLAVDVYEKDNIEGTRQVRWLLNKLYDQADGTGESDLLSHLLFDSCYTKAAEALGFSDAQNSETELLRFFGVEQPS